MENKFSFPPKNTLHSLKHPFMDCPACSMTVLNKKSYRLMEHIVVVQSSQKTDNSNRTARTWARCSRQKEEKYNLLVSLKKNGTEF